MRSRLAGVLALLWPSAAHACAVCFSATDRNRIAFLITTIVLSLLPLAMIGAGLLWLARRARRAGERGRLVSERGDRQPTRLAPEP